MLEETIEVPLNEESLRSVVPEVQSRLEDGTVRELLEQDVPNHEIDVVLKAHIRYEGTDTALVPPPLAVATCCVNLADPLSITHLGCALMLFLREGGGFSAG